MPDTSVSFISKILQVADLGSVAERFHGSTDVAVTMKRATPGTVTTLSDTLPAHTGGLLIVFAFMVGAGDPTHENTYIKVKVGGVLVYDAPVGDFSHVSFDLTYGQTSYVGDLVAGNQLVQVEFRSVGYIDVCGFKAHVVGTT